MKQPKELTIKLTQLKMLALLFTDAMRSDYPNCEFVICI